MRFKIFKKFMKEVNKLRSKDVDSVEINLEYEDIEMLKDSVVDFYISNISELNYRPRYEIRASLSNSAYKRGLDVFIKSITRKIKYEIVYIDIRQTNPYEHYIEIIKVNGDRYFALQRLRVIK